MSTSFPSPTKTYHTNTYPSISPSLPALSATGKSILITGGGTGIGASIARSFAEAGASRIALLGRREQPLLETKALIERDFPSVDIFTASVDVTNQSEVNAAFASFAGEGKLNVVVSNASDLGPRESIEEVDSDAFVTSVERNVKGAFHIAQAFARYAADDAVAINVSSSAAHYDFGPIYTAYNVGKMAAVRLWDALANARRELSIFHIQPGVVDTAMNRAVGGIALIGCADDVSLPGNFSVWLASPEAQFLKGKFLWTNWDVDELKEQKEELENTHRLRVGLIGWPFGKTE